MSDSKVQTSSLSSGFFLHVETLKERQKQAIPLAARARMVGTLFWFRETFTKTGGVLGGVGRVSGVFDFRPWPAHLVQRTPLKLT